MEKQQIKSDQAAGRDGCRDLRAPSNLRDIVSAVSQLSKLIIAGQAGCDVAKAGHILHRYHTACETEPYK